MRPYDHNMGTATDFLPDHIIMALFDFDTWVMEKVITSLSSSSSL